MIIVAGSLLALLYVLGVGVVIGLAMRDERKRSRRRR